MSSNANERKPLTPGTFMFTFMDNGVTSQEYWRIVDCADDLTWSLYYYAGAAKVGPGRYCQALHARHVIENRSTQWNQGSKSLESHGEQCVYGPLSRWPDRRTSGQCWRRRTGCGRRQGLTLVHISAQRERFLWNTWWILGLLRGCLGGVQGVL